MLPEWLESLLIPCPRSVRVLGYLHELRNIRRRYRVWRSAWEPHCRRTRQVILSALARTRQRRKAILLGTGYLHDVPLAELASSFQEVILVDVLHPLSTRWKTRRYRNVHLLAEDVTGTLEGVVQAAHDRNIPLPQKNPELFLHDPEIDLIASINLLSQLPCMPERYLLAAGVHSSEAILAYARQLITAHLAWLTRFSAIVALIADVESLTINTTGQTIRQTSTLYGLEPPVSDESWIWPLVPLPRWRPRTPGLPPQATHLRVIASADLHHALQSQPSRQDQAPVK